MNTNVEIIWFFLNLFYTLKIQFVVSDHPILTSAQIRRPVNLIQPEN